MPSTKNLMVASILFMHSITQAITLSVNIDANKQSAKMSGMTILSPEYSTNANKVIEFGMLAEHTNPSFFMDSVSASVHGAYQHSDIYGFFGSAGITTYLKNNYLYGQGSLELSPSNSPFVSAGGFYKSQSGSIIELGAAFTRLTTDLSTTSTGGLFNGFPTLQESSLGFNTLILGVNINIHINKRLYVYTGMHFGTDLFDTQLPNETRIGTEYRSILTTYTEQTPPVTIGSLYGRNTSLVFHKLTIGTRINITEFYE